MHIWCISDGVHELSIATAASSVSPTAQPDAERGKQTAETKGLSACSAKAMINVLPNHL